MSPSTLSPSAALNLSSLQDTTGRSSFETALNWLLVKGALKIEQRLPPRYRLGKTSYLMIGSAIPMPPHCSDLITLARQDSGDACQMQEFIAAARKKYGSEFKSYRALILEELCSAGLIERYEEPKYIFFTSTKLRPTPAGEKAREEINSLTSELKMLPRLLGSDPQKAAALAQKAGDMILLRPELIPYFPALAEVVKRHTVSESLAGSPSTFLTLAVLSLPGSAFGLDGFGSCLDSADSLDIGGFDL